MDGVDEVMCTTFTWSVLEPMYNDHTVSTKINVQPSHGRCMDGVDELRCNNVHTVCTKINVQPSYGRCMDCVDELRCTTFTLSVLKSMYNHHTVGAWMV